MVKQCKLAKQIIFKSADSTIMQCAGSACSLLDVLHSPLPHKVVKLLRTVQLLRHRAELQRQQQQWQNTCV
jgi:hypothetical protein